MTRLASGKTRFVVLAATLALAFLASACAQGREVALSADGQLMQRLERIVERDPLPEGWTIAHGERAPSWTIRLTASPKQARPRPAASEASCGGYYLAAAVDLADGRYSVARAEAEKIGLVDLETIAMPRRALSVDGLWPGSAGYPFAYDLELSASGAAAGAAVPSELDAWIRAAAAAERTVATSPLLLAAGGDIQVGQDQAAAIVEGQERLESLVAPELLARIKGADFAVANLESPISSSGDPNPKKRFQFRMPSGSSSLLRDSGLDLLLFANNHGFDYGPQAFLDTLGELERDGPPQVGAGKNSSEAAAARSIATGSGERLAFVGFAFYPAENYGFSLEDAAAGAGKPGIATDEEATVASIRAAAAAGETVIVLAHGGAEYQQRPSKAASALYDRFAQAGAALVLGSHPHILQGCAARDGSLIAYSLGNFIFTKEREPEAAWKSGLLELLLYRGKVRGLRLFPTVAGYDGTAADPNRAAAEARFSRLCAELE